MERKPQAQQLQAFLEDVYVQYKTPLLKIVHKYIENPDVYEDIFHDIFIRIILNSEMFYFFSKPQLEAYIYLIAKGISIDYLRKTSKHAQVNLTDDAFSRLVAQKSAHTSDSFDAFDRADFIMMIDKLPVDDQILLVGKYYLGLSIEDLVSILGGTSTAVRSKLHRVRKKVFEEWTKAGLSMEDFLNG